MNKTKLNLRKWKKNPLLNLNNICIYRWCNRWYFVGNSDWLDRLSVVPAYSQSPWWSVFPAGCCCCCCCSGHSRLNRCLAAAKTLISASVVPWWSRRRVARWVDSRCWQSRRADRADSSTSCPPDSTLSTRLDSRTPLAICSEFWNDRQKLFQII